MLSPRLLEILRAHWKRARPGLWLFPGRDPGGHVTIRAVQGSPADATGRDRQPLLRAFTLSCAARSRAIHPGISMPMP